MPRWLRIAYTYSLVVPGLVVISIGVLLASVARLPRPWIDALYRAYAHFAISVGRVRIRQVRWKVSPESLPRQLVIVANHESHLDTLVMLKVLRSRSLRYVAKKSLFVFPVFGWALWASGNVSVSRGSDTRHDLDKLRDPKAREHDVDVGFFPEGTRSRDGNMASFKKGAFAFAITNQRPILPVGIGGTRERLASHDLEVRPGDVAVVVGEPISTAGLRYEDRDQLRAGVEAAVRALRQEALELAGSPRARLRA